MRKLLQTVAISALLFAPAATAQAQVSFGIRIGEPPAPKAYRVPPRPGPGYEWVEGYWSLQGRHYTWRNGYWARPPYRGAYWSSPYYSDGRYYAGRWEGDRSKGNHDRRGDRR